MSVVSSLNQFSKPANQVKTSSFDKPTTVEQLLATAAETNGSRQVDQVKDSFWVNSVEEIARYNKLYPYQLIMVEAFVNNSGDVSHRAVPGWTYTFPLPPESFRIHTPFAINGSVTLGGYIEEHNGAPIRMISARGTTGFVPSRGTGAPANVSSFSLAGLTQSIAGGTINQLSRIENGVTTLIAGAGVAPKNRNLHLDAEFDIDPQNQQSVLAKSTGYYQWHRLQRFLEAYSTLLKSKASRNYRLAFAIWKDQAIYLVTPQSVSFERSAQSPMETVYDIQLKGYRRIVLDAGTFQYTAPPALRRDPGALARILNTISGARVVLQRISGLSPAVLGDVEKLLFEPLREMSFACKDFQGAKLSLAELPKEIVKACKQNWLEIAATFPFGRKETDKATRTTFDDGRAAANENSPLGSQSLGAIQSGILSNHPALAPFDDPVGGIGFMSQIDVAALKLNKTVLDLIQKERLRVQNISRRDFEIKRDQVQVVYDSFANSVGLGNDTYNNTYKVSSTAQAKVATKSDWETLATLNDTIECLNSFASTEDSGTSTNNKMETMAAAYRRIGQAFNVPSSKFAVPFPYGSTLESLAKTYLGDEHRWTEIATLNGLKDPWIDEVGFSTTLLTNGANNQVIVPIGTNLYLNQQVWIKSDTISRTTRRIQNLKEVGTSLIVSLDGANDLGYYKVAENAMLEAFLPDTINSRQLIYIPSDVEPDIDSFITKDIPGLDPFDRLAFIGGVDLLLGLDNDIVITSSGDTPWSFGLTNVIQNLRIGFSIVQGTCPLHPDVGLPAEIGINLANVSSSNILAAVKKMVANDATFTKLDYARVRLSGSALAIDVGITPIGTEHVIPINYNVTR